MMQYVIRMDPQRVPFFAGALILLVAATLLGYLIVPQYRAQRAASHDLASLQQSVKGAPSVAAEQARLQADIKRLEDEIRNDAHGMSQQNLVAFVTGRLQEISWGGEIELMAIQSSPGARIEGIQETLFQLEVAGEYADLHNWLRNIRVELDFATVTQLTLAPLENQHHEPRLGARLVVAAYSTTQ